MIEDAALHGVDEATKTTRGAGFPALSLPDSVDIIKKAAQYGRQQQVTALASYAGHSTATSGPFRQKLAALKDWGLITTTGKMVTITDRGMGIALPTSPDAAVDLQVAAFKGCSLFWKLYADSGKGVPLKIEFLGNQAVNTYGVGISSRDKFLKSFVDSAVSVGLAEQVSSGEVKLFAVTEKAGSLSTPLERIEDEASPITGSELQQPVKSNTLASDGKPVIHQLWTNDSIGIVFEVRSKNPLPAAAFVQVAETIAGIEALWDAMQEHAAGDDGL